MKYYIATTLSNIKQHNALRNYLEVFGHQITYDWTAHGSVINEGLESVREVCLLEIAGVREADIVIVLFPGDRGTHVELGMALAFEKKIIIVSKDQDVFTGDKTCAFYHHPLVTWESITEDVLWSF